METHTKENGEMIKRMEEVSILIIQQVKNMKENGKLESVTEKEFTTLHLVTLLMDCKIEGLNLSYI